MSKNTSKGRRISRIWPKKLWKKAVLVVLLIIAFVGVPIVAYFEYSVYREVAAPLDVLNPTGTNSALTIYHPGLTSFSHDITYSFAERLASNGWRVEITTASAQAPTDITKYQLLVLIWPIYDFNPGPALTSYIQRIGDLQSKDTVIVTIGGGINPFSAQDAMKQIISDSHGTIRDSTIIFRGGNFTEAADQAASKILP